MVNEIRELSEELNRVSVELAESRKKSTKYKLDFEVFLLADLKNLLAVKRNAGIDTLYLLIREKSTLANEAYIEWQREETKVRGLDGIFEAVRERLNAEKLIIKLEGGHNVGNN